LKKMQAWARRTIAWWLDDGFDLLVTPSLAEPPPVLGELTDPVTGGGRLLPFVLFTAPFNVTGQPAMSVPLAMSPGGLPVGVQFVAAPYREDLLFQVAGALERAQPWAERRPSVHA
jgi:amidase